MDKLTRRTFFGWLAGAVSAVAAGVVVLKKPEPWEDINATVKGVEYDQFGIPKTTPERIEQYKQIAEMDTAILEHDYETGKGSYTKTGKVKWEVPKEIPLRVEAWGGHSGYLGSHTMTIPNPYLNLKT